MTHIWPLRIVKGVLIAALACIVIGFFVMTLWNALIPDLFKGPVLTFWQAVGLLVLSHILLRGWGPWRHMNGWRHDRWRNRFDEKFASMTPEEREKMRAEWKHRCFGGSDDPEKAGA